MVLNAFDSPPHLLVTLENNCNLQKIFNVSRCAPELVHPVVARRDYPSVDFGGQSSLKINGSEKNSQESRFAFANLKTQDCDCSEKPGAPNAPHRSMCSTTIVDEKDTLLIRKHFLHVANM